MILIHQTISLSAISFASAGPLSVLICFSGAQEIVDDGVLILA